MHPTHWLISTQLDAEEVRPHHVEVSEAEVVGYRRDELDLVRRRLASIHVLVGVEGRDTHADAAGADLLRDFFEHGLEEAGTGLEGSTCVEINQCVGCTRQFFKYSLTSRDGVEARLKA